MRRFTLLLTAICFCITASASVKDYKVKVLKKYPHDEAAYTQGLFFHDGKLYETTGQYGKSNVRIVDLASGKALKNIPLASRYFGEGSSVVDGKMYVLTWTNRLALVYDIDSFKYEKMLSYPREGWGLTSIPEDRRHEFNNAVLIASDGSSTIFFLDRKLSAVKTLTVRLDGRPVRLLNELEWIDGKIWANVYTTDLIVIIDPLTGKVTGKIDCSGLIPREKRTASMDVLNGIAAKPSEDGGTEIFLTGKNWPWLFKVSVSEH